MPGAPSYLPRISRLPPEARAPAGARRCAQVSAGAQVSTGAQVRALTSGSRDFRGPHPGLGVHFRAEDLARGVTALKTPEMLPKSQAQRGAPGRAGGGPAARGSGRAGPGLVPPPATGRRAAGPSPGPLGGVHGAPIGVGRRLPPGGRGRSGPRPGAAVAPACGPQASPRAPDGAAAPRAHRWPPVLQAPTGPGLPLPGTPRPRATQPGGLRPCLLSHLVALQPTG